MMNIPDSLLEELRIYLMMQTEANDAEAQYLLYRLDELNKMREDPIETAKLIVPPPGEELRC
ncbi:MAG: hypothetical protein AAGA60_09025 [Cyanobacteria bacterium P01_E01_bin.42]